jgi:guanylate kinase
MKTKMILVAAPSGAGKSSFLERIIKEVPQLEDVVTYTTRTMRTHESEGVHYHFITHADFDKKVSEGFFIEWAKVHANFYGTSFESIQSAWNRGKVVIMDLDVQGVETFKAKHPKGLKTIFILPPSPEELTRRIINRDNKVPIDLDLRIKNAEIEIRKASGYDFQIINDDFETSYSQFKKIIEDLLIIE